MMTNLSNKISSILRLSLCFINKNTQKNTINKTFRFIAKLPSMKLSGNSETNKLLKKELEEILILCNII